MKTNYFLILQWFYKAQTVTPLFLFEAIGAKRKSSGKRKTPMRLRARDCRFLKKAPQKLFCRVRCEHNAPNNNLSSSHIFAYEKGQILVESVPFFKIKFLLPQASFHRCCRHRSLPRRGRGRWEPPFSLPPLPFPTQARPLPRRQLL